MNILVLEDNENVLSKELYERNYDYIDEASWKFSVSKDGFKLKDILLEIGRYGAHYRMSFIGNEESIEEFIKFVKDMDSFYLTKYLSMSDDSESDELKSAVEISVKEMGVKIILNELSENNYKATAYFCLKGERAKPAFNLNDSFPEDDDINDLVLDCFSFNDDCYISYGLILETVNDYELEEEEEVEEEEMDCENCDKLQRISILQAEIQKRDRYIDELEKELSIKDEIIRKQVVMMTKSREEHDNDSEK